MMKKRLMLKESLLKEDASEKVKKVAEAIKQLKAIDVNHFYVALMIYDVLGIEKPSEELINKVAEYIDDLDTVYDSYARDEIRIIAEELDGPAEAEEVKVDVDVDVPEAPVEEKLGEFKKSEQKRNNDFDYKE